MSTWIWLISLRNWLIPLIIFLDICFGWMCASDVWSLFSNMYIALQHTILQTIIFMYNLPIWHEEHVYLYDLWALISLRCQISRVRVLVRCLCCTQNKFRRKPNHTHGKSFTQCRMDFVGEGIIGLKKGSPTWFNVNLMINLLICMCCTYFVLVLVIWLEVMLRSAPKWYKCIHAESFKRQQKTSASTAFGNELNTNTNIYWSMKSRTPKWATLRDARLHEYLLGQWSNDEDYKKIHHKLFLLLWLNCLSLSFFSIRFFFSSLADCTRIHVQHQESKANWRNHLSFHIMVKKVIDVTVGQSVKPNKCLSSVKPQ